MPSVAFVLPPSLLLLRATLIGPVHWLQPTPDPHAFHECNVSPRPRPTALTLTLTLSTSPRLDCQASRPTNTALAQDIWGAWRPSRAAATVFLLSISSPPLRSLTRARLPCTSSTAAAP